jgi:sterol 3beta-glucosyltransferase
LSLRIVMMALGSRGDVQPFAALGVALAARGHAVRLLTYGSFADLVAGKGVTLVPVEGDIQADLKGPEATAMFAEGAKPGVVMAAMRAFAEKNGESWARLLLEEARTADLLIPAGASVFIGASVAEALNIPYVHAYPQPTLPTRAFPSAMVPPQGKRPGLGNLLQSWMISIVFWQIFRKSVNRVRRELLGLQPYPFQGPYWRWHRQGLPMLMEYSPILVPRPEDWPPAAKVVGFWFLDHPEWEMPVDLSAFLAAGPAPVYIGFGSMMPGDPARTTRIIVEAVRKVGCRAVLAGGWGGLKPSGPTPDIFPLSAAPHDRLLPHMAAVVHHGGAGTTAAGVRAGVPAVIVPFLADQFFWAWRLDELGVCGGMLRHRDLDADQLAAAIRRCLEDQGMRERAVDLGRRVRAEDGLGAAVREIEAVVAAR